MLTRQERQQELRAKLYGDVIRSAARDLHAVQMAPRGAAPVESWMPDMHLIGLAAERAALMRDRISALEGGALADELMRAQLSAWLVELEAKALPSFREPSSPTACAHELIGWIDRAVCPLWWRRVLRRRAVLLREREARHAGEVHASGQTYCTDDTVKRRALRQARTRTMLEETELEDANGEVLALWDAVEKSTANPAVRRAELMTRIRGCDEWANAHGFVGIFTTNTTPSRFHSRLAIGDINRHWDKESTPLEGQAWLRDTWARARAKLHRRKIGVFGLRVAEPHHDGTPHWHMLLWVKPDHVEVLQKVLRDTWLREDAHERGAQEHRFKAVKLWPGGAAGYVAKYVAKGIDDAGALEREGHVDEGTDGKRLAINASAARVLGWASAWGIRQFQTIGQPPVSVWRELRRVEADALEGASDRLRAAHAAVHRKDWSKVNDKPAGERRPEDRACWRAYMAAQGGPMQGRKNLLAIETQEREHAPRYGLDTVKAVPVAVLDRESGSAARSSRKEWRPRGTWTEQERRAAKLRDAAWTPAKRREALEGVSAFGDRAKPVRPWTRFNNCTRQGGAAALMAAGIVGAERMSRVRTGGGTTLESNSCLKPPPEPPPKSPTRPTSCSSKRAAGPSPRT